VLSGDTDAFGPLATRHEALVAAVCRRLLKDDHEVADAAQETFLRAYENLWQLRDPARVRAWLRRVAYSVCMNRLAGRAGAAVRAMAPEELDAVDVPGAQADPARQAQACEAARAGGC